MGSSNRTTKKVVDIAPKRKDGEPFVVAGTTEGRHNATLLAADYDAKRAYIRTTRSLRRMCRSTALEPRNITTLRRGYPKKRERNEDIPSHKGVPHSNFLKRFKLVDRITFSKAAGDIVYSTKVWVLHATRGWKLYA